jgi:nicotinate phosphoribosyltransferase
MRQGRIIPKIKISENTAKITNPGFKKVYRFYDKKTGKATADEICLHEEAVAENASHTIFDPEDTWKQRTLTNFTVRELLVPSFQTGRPGLQGTDPAGDTGLLPAGNRNPVGRGKTF